MKTMEHHGVSSAALHMTGNDWLKKEILFYDKVSLVHLNQAIYELRHGRQQRPTRAAELEYLVDEGIIIEARLPSETSTDEKILSAYSDATRSDDRIDELLASKVRDQNWENELQKAIQARDAFLIRACAVAADNEGKTISTALVSPSSFDDISRQTSQVRTARVVLNNFPIPGGGTSFQDIIHLRQDSELQEMKRSLRRWIRNLDTSRWTDGELQEEITDLMEQYRNYMRLQKIKHERGSLSGLIKVVATTLESTAKLKLAKLAELGVDIIQGNSALTEAELAAPGRELSYAIKLHDRIKR